MNETVHRERRLLKLILSPRSSCVSTMQLALPDAQALAHISICPRCQAERALLAEFESTKPEPEEESKVTWISLRLEERLASQAIVVQLPRSRWRRWFSLHSLGTFGFALATAVVLVALGFGFFERKPRLTDPGELSALRSGEIGLLAPLGDVDGAPAELRWEKIAGAASYEVRVLEVDRAPLWTGNTSLPAAALPPKLVVPGKPLLWQVTARDSAGNALAQSALQRFRLKQP